MQTHLIEIIPDEVTKEEGWGDWAVRNVKQNGWKAAIPAVVVLPILPAAVGTVAVGAGLVSGVQNGIDWLRGTDDIVKLEISKAYLLKDAHDRPVRVEEIYAVHPDKTRSNFVVAASEFHDFVISEQISDLVSYIRGAVRAESISITVESERSGSFSGNLLSKFSLKGDAGVAKHHSVELTYENPDIIVSDNDLFWLQIFPEIEAAFSGARKGSVKRMVTVDTTFGLSASSAKQAGIDSSWLGKQRFSIEARFG